MEDVKMISVYFLKLLKFLKRFSMFHGMAKHYPSQKLHCGVFLVDD